MYFLWLHSSICCFYTRGLIISITRLFSLCPNPLRTLINTTGVTTAMLLEVSVESIGRPLWVVVAVCGVIALTKKVLESRKIHRLGGRATPAPGYWFFFGALWDLSFSLYFLFLGM